MEPCAITGLETRRDGDTLVVRTRVGSDVPLDSVTAFVWQHADGRTSPGALVQRVEERFGIAEAAHVVWKALDELADEGLLVERVAPPTGTVTRRALFRTAATGLAVAAAAAAVPAAGSAWAAEERRKAGSDEQGAKLSAERANKVGGPSREQEAKLAVSPSREQEMELGTGPAREQEAKLALGPSREQTVKSSSEEGVKASGGAL